MIAGKLLGIAALLMSIVATLYHSEVTAVCSVTDALVGLGMIIGAKD